MKQNNKKNI